MSDIKLFEDKQVRTYWDEKEQQWYFSIIDVVEVLTNSSNPRDYWFKMKVGVRTEDGLQLSTIYRQLKLKATAEKRRELIVQTQRYYYVSSNPSPRPKLNPLNNGWQKSGMNACRK